MRAYSVNRGELGLVRARPDGFRPGQDVAGVVVETSEGGPAVGTRVVGIVDWHGWAERVAAPVNFVAPIADNVTFEQAATLPVAGLMPVCWSAASRREHRGPAGAGDGRDASSAPPDSSAGR